IHWCLIIIAVGFLWQMQQQLFSLPILPLALSAALILPLLNLLILQIPNAAVLLFPAWLQSAREGPHGIEATGQRIIFLLGQMLVLMVALVPAVVVVAVAFFLLRLVLPLEWVIPLAAIAAAIVLSVEGILGLLL